MHRADARLRRPLLVGLTGGVASGKSTVARLFEAEGVPVLDTDAIAREVVAPGSDGLARLRAAFGDDILDEHAALDRGAMRRRAFADPAARRLLEDIVHPLVLEALARQSATAGGPYQVHVIPLLVETGLRDRVDRVLVVDCEPARQLARLLARDAGSRDEAERMMAAQVDRETRLASADDVLSNDGPLEDLPPLVRRLHEYYLALANDARHGAPGIRLP